MILYDDEMSWAHSDGYVVLRAPFVTSRLRGWHVAIAARPWMGNSISQKSAKNSQGISVSLPVWKTEVWNPPNNLISNI